MGSSGLIGGLRVVVVALRGRRKMPVEREERFNADAAVCNVQVHSVIH